VQPVQVFVFVACAAKFCGTAVLRAYLEVVSGFAQECFPRLHRLGKSWRTSPAGLPFYAINPSDGLKFLILR
jgi:hypothetical protein